MFKLSYKENGIVKDVEFDSYAKILLFVATNRIKDEDFVSITLGETEIVGINSLYEKAAEMAQEQIDFEEELKSMFEEELDEDEFCDEELEA